jgi:anti-sigma factor RsiW
MKHKLSEIELLDYIDGSLDVAHHREVEEFLRTHQEEAEMVADIQMALMAVRDLEETEPVRAGENFWPRLRDKLPERRSRGWLHSLLAPVRSQPLRISMGAAIAAIFIGMAVFLFSPQGSIPTPVADQIPADARQFVTRSLQRHQNYGKAQPLSGSQPLGGPLGDFQSSVGASPGSVSRSGPGD